jgi:hypothetical protein
MSSTPWGLAATLPGSNGLLPQHQNTQQTRAVGPFVSGYHTPRTTLGRRTAHERGQIQDGKADALSRKETEPDTLPSGNV